MAAIPLVDALRSRAMEDPTRPAITDQHGTLTRREVDALSDRAANALLALGAGPGSVVAMTGSNSARLLTLFFATWKIGATPLPLHSRKGAAELTSLLLAAEPAVIVGFDHEVARSLDGRAVVTTLDGLFRTGEPTVPPAGIVSARIRIGVSGGSTGASKLIVVDVPAIINPERPWHVGLRPDGTHVVPLDIVDGTGFVATTAALALGCHQVLMETFDAETLLRLIARYRADWLALTQPAMVALVKLSPDVRQRYDLASLRCMTHYSGGVAEWVKRAWIDWLGADRVAESYGATDSRGSTWIDGATWLERPGSVGRAGRGCELAIFDDAGQPLATGRIGNVYIRDTTGHRNFRYIGAVSRSLPGGWETVGDAGWMDDDGFLYIVDRAADMIHTSTGDVAPLPIEGAIEHHAAVRSAVVIGMPAGDGFDRVHAIVDTGSEHAGDDELASMLADRFPGIPRPDSWERTDDGPLRDNAGKARRQLLRAQRLTSPHQSRQGSTS